MNTGNTPNKDTENTKTEEEIKKEIGERITSLRKGKNETQADLAKILSTTQNNISKIERGTNTITLDKMLILAKHYDVSLDYLCRGIEGKNVLETLNKYIQYEIFNSSWEEDKFYPIPHIKIEENYYHYLNRVACIKNIKDEEISDDIKKDWIAEKERDFKNKIIENKKCKFIEIIPLEKISYENKETLIPIIEKDIYRIR